MIHVKVHNARNLSIPNHNPRKIKILCFSSSSYFKYYHKSFKTEEKTINPEWEAEFDADLYQCDVLTFFFYGCQLFSFKIFLGRADFNLSGFLLHEREEKLIYTNPKLYQVELPITSCETPNATLSISVLYFPKIYRQISTSSYNIRIHFVTNYKPNAPSNYDVQVHPIEIELLQAFTNQEKQTGVYFKCDEKTTWETVGCVSPHKYISNEEQKSQISSFSLQHFQNTFNFVILHSSDVSGFVNLSIIYDHFDILKIINNKIYYRPNQNKIGLLKSVDLEIESNTTYCFPLYLYSKEESSKNKFRIEKFPCLTYKNLFEKTEEENSNELEFYSSIIENAKTIIPEFKNIKFTRTNVMSEIYHFSLFKVFNDFNLPASHNLKIYVTGENTCVDSDGNVDVSIWKPQFIIYDKLTNKIDAESNILSPESIPYKQSNIYNIHMNSFTKINLDLFDVNKVIIFAICCSSCLNSSSEGGFQ